MKHKWKGGSFKSCYVRNKVNEIIDSVEVKHIDNARDILDGAKKYVTEKHKAPIKPTEQDLKAIMVNHIRHECTNYDESIKEMNKLLDASNVKEKRLSYYMLKNSVLSKIAEIYPYLADECKSQKHTVDLMSGRRKY